MELNSNQSTLHTYTLLCAFIRILHAHFFIKQRGLCTHKVTSSKTTPSPIGLVCAQQDVGMYIQPTLLYNVNCKPNNCACFLNIFY